MTGSFWLGLAADAAGRAGVRPAARGGGLPPPLRARPPGAGAGDVRPDPVPQPGREDWCGAPPRSACRCPMLLSGSVRLMDGLLYPVYRLVLIGDGPCRGAAALRADQQDAGRHAGAGRRQQCADRVRARRRYRPAVHDRVRLRRDAGGLRRRDGGADPVGRARHGRQPADPDVRRHRDRRHRLDPRRVHRGADGRPDRYARPRVRAAVAAHW